MAIQTINIDDYVMAGIRELGKGRLTDASRPYQTYPGLNQILKALKKTAEGALGMQWDVLIKDNGSAREVGSHSQDAFEEVDGLIQAKADFQKITANWQWDIADQVFNSGDKTQILNYLDVKMTQAYNSKDKKLEECVWKKPADVNDNLKIRGLPYSIVPNNAATSTPATLVNDGFEGYNAAGFPAGPFGVDATAYPMTANQVGLYVNPNIGELDEILKRVSYKMQFDSPVGGPGIPDFADGPPDHEIYTTFEGRNQLERMGLQANDSAGLDVSFYMGKMLFRGNQVIAVPALDSISVSQGIYTPYYLINWQYVRPMIMPGWWYRIDDPQRGVGRHTVRTQCIDSQLTIVNHDRRQGGGLVYKIAA